MFGHYYQDTSIPIMPNDLSDGFANDPTLHRWTKGKWAKICDGGVSAIILCMLIAPLRKFGTISNQEKLGDTTIKNFEIEWDKHLKNMRFEVKITDKSWNDIKSELSTDASDDEIVKHFCDEWIEISFY